jgi:hypothetical protein
MVLNICLTKVIIMKGLAVTQVILLILGIIVLAIIGYLLYSNYISSVGTVSVEQCKTNLINVCNSCKIAKSVIGKWDPSKYDDLTDPAKGEGCGKITKTCIEALKNAGIISVTSQTYDESKEMVAQSVCTSVAVS